MQVYHAVWIRRQNGLVHHAHVSCHDDVVHVMHFELGRYNLVGHQGLGIELFRDGERLQTVPLRPLEPVGVHARRHDQLYAGVQRALLYAVYDGLQVGARPREKNAQLYAHAYTTLPVPATILPMANESNPSASSSSRTRSTSCAAQITLMPTPMLKVLYASSGVREAARTI